MNNAPELKNCKILVAEDEFSNYEYLRLLLSRAGAEIIWAKNGEEAVSKYQEYPDVNLILMDIRMPLMNGHEAARKIRDLGATLPIIAQTAYATAEDMDKAMEAGCDDFISKPIRKDKLFNMLEERLT